MADDNPPPRVLCENCQEPITYVGNYTGQPTTAVAMVADGQRLFECGCAETPDQWEIRHDGIDLPSSTDPTWMHPDGCRCEVCLDA